MTANNGWPGKPGVPLNPERDGWHWLKTGHGVAPWLWRDDPQSITWEMGWETNEEVFAPGDIARVPGTTYLGPCLTPDEVAKREDAKWHEGYAVGVLDVRRGTAFGEPDTHYAALQKRIAELEAVLDFCGCIDHYQTHGAAAFVEKEKAWDAWNNPSQPPPPAIGEKEAVTLVSDMAAEITRLRAERDALHRDASQEIATDELVRRLQRLGDWQAADRIEALQARVAELEGALDFYACVDHYQTHNAAAPNVVQTDRGAKARAALEKKKVSPTMTEAELREMMRDPRYWRTREPEFVNKVRDGFRKLTGGKDE